MTWIHSREHSDARGILQQAFRAKEIPGLDAMRASAIVMVVLFHQGLPISGGLGVTMFFVLSGFLITRLLLDELKKSRRFRSGPFISEGVCGFSRLSIYVGR